MTWSNLRFNISRSFVTMATNLPSCFSIEFLEQILKFLVNFTLQKYVKSQRSYGFLITKDLIFGFQILDLKDHFSASLKLIFRYYKYPGCRLVSSNVTGNGRYFASYRRRNFIFFHSILFCSRTADYL